MENIFQQIGGKQIYVNVAKDLNVRISQRELQVSITHWVRMQVPYKIEILSTTEHAVVLKFSNGQTQEELKAKVQANQTQKAL